MRRLLTYAAFLALTCTILFSQAAPPSDVVINSGNFSPIVQDLDRSMDFYNDLFEITAPASVVTPRPFGNDSGLLNFLGAPTAQIRFDTVRIPGSSMSVEIVDFKDIDRKPLQPRLQDPGAVRLILLVRDLDTLFARLKKKSIPVVTAGGTPVSLTVNGGKARSVIVKDPDGHFIQLMQPDPLPETTAPATSNVIGARFGLTVADMDQTMRVYRDLLGFQFQLDPSFTNDKPVADLLNTPGAQIRSSAARVPGSAVQVQFLEFKGIDRKPIGARIQDPGATRFQLRVRDTDATVKSLKATGGAVITTGGDGGPINMRGLRVALVQEPNNLFLVIMAQGQPAPPPAR
jgi:predicted enzyme related to lactoylglutathione lyase